MIKAIIIDDEKDSIDTLKWKLDTYCPQVNVIASFNDPTKGLEYLQQHQIDLLFLDIEMPRLNGFDILQELETIAFDVIFVTAYSDFGIQAIKFSALDYLLKPVQVAELQKAVAKYQDKTAQSMISNEQFSLLFKNVHLQKEGKTGLIPLSTKESIEFAEPDQIIFFESDSNYTHVHFKDGRKKLIAKTLKEFDLMLSDAGFFRPHHSYLVNLKQVKEYMKIDGGYLIMKNGIQVPVSKGRRESFLNRLSNLT